MVDKEGVAFLGLFFSLERHHLQEFLNMGWIVGLVHSEDSESSVSVLNGNQVLLVVREGHNLFNGLH